MSLIEIVQNQNWAIVPEKLDAIHQVLLRHSKDWTTDWTSIDAKVPSKNPDAAPYEVMDGVAVIPVYGVLAKRMNMFMAFSGGTSMELLGRDFAAALRDEDVEAILLDVDSPGGTVDGTEALADLVYNAKGKKPIIAYVNGLMASAAYWVGSAADHIVIEETGEAGSIGVIMVHYDYSKADKNQGVKRTHIYAGKYKAVGNSAEPLNKDGKAYLQEGVDYMYSIFVETVARNRAVDVDTVLKDMADGRIFIGRQAEKAGLVDGIGNFGTAFNLAVEAVRQTKNNQAKEVNIMFDKDKKVEITVETVKADFPEVAAELLEEGKNSVDVTEAVDKAVATEMENILSLVNIQFGDEAGANFGVIVRSGVTPGQLTAIKAMNPEPKPIVATLEETKPNKMDEMFDEIKKAGAENPGTGFDTNELAGLTGEELWKKEYAKDKELQEEFSGVDIYVAFKKAEKSGKVKVLKTK